MIFSPDKDLQRLCVCVCVWQYVFKPENPQSDTTGNRNNMEQSVEEKKTKETGNEKAKKTKRGSEVFCCGVFWALCGKVIINININITIIIIIIIIMICLIIYFCLGIAFFSEIFKKYFFFVFVFMNTRINRTKVISVLKSGDSSTVVLICLYLPFCYLNKS